MTELDNNLPVKNNKLKGNRYRKGAKELLEEAHKETDKPTDRRVKKQVVQLTHIQRIALFAEGLMLYDGNKTRAYHHAGMGENAGTNASGNANNYWSKHRKEIQSFLRNEFSNQLLSKVGRAMQAVAQVLEDEEEKGMTRLKAAELIVKWSGVSNSTGEEESTSPDDTPEIRRQRIKQIMDKIKED